MEIKTTKAIIFENSTKTFINNNGKNILFDSDNTKWVKVEDVIKVLDEGFGVENNLPTIKPLILLKFYKELTGKELK